MKKSKLTKCVSMLLVFMMTFFMGVNVNVMAADTETPDNAEKALQYAFSPGESSSADSAAAEDIDLAENDPQINMAGSQKALRTMQARTNNSKERYTVLVLDTSASSDFLDSSGRVFYTADTAIEYVKTSAKKFIESVQNADGTNYVAIVEYKGSRANVVSPFSTDLTALSSSIDDLYAYGGTRNVAAGLQQADQLIEEIDNPDAIKNVVLFTTGMTNDGEYSYDGHYDENTVGSSWRRNDTQVRLYAYSNIAYSVAESLKNEATLYSIGLFQTMQEMPDEGKEVVQFFKLFASELATSDDYFYDVKDPNDLEFVFGEVADDINNEAKEIEFTYQSGSDYTAKCYYTDKYFSESAYDYNASLATMSLSYAMSAFNSSKGGSDYTNKSVNAKELLANIGVPEENIETNEWFTVKPSTDSIGVIAGNKEITVNNEKYTLIAVAVRGGGYEQEWTSNFTIGKTGQHEGFDEAKNNVISFLDEYIQSQNISGKVKFWITGYSRGAATANLVSGAIDDGVFQGGALEYSNADVYSYCFETPAGALTSETKGVSRYYNIFNIINSSDVVPLVAPAALGFCRYGVDKYLPSAESSADYAKLKDNMLDVFNSMESTSDYVVDDFQMKKLALDNWLPGGEKISFIQDDLDHNYSQGLFLSNYVTILSNEFLKSRSNYVDNFQDEIREICSIFFGCTGEQSEILLDSIIRQAKDEWGDLLWSYIWNTGINPWGDEDDALQMISDWLHQAVKEAGITGYNQETLDRAGRDLADLMLALISNHPNYFTTAVMNKDSLAAAHYPELCFAWLASMDSNYSGENGEQFNNGGYRIIRINCNVDVEVFDSSGQRIAAIINEEPQKIEGSEYVAGIDQDGQKYVALPNEAEYRAVITAREDDSVNYSISEYSAGAGEYTRLINYFDIQMKAGEKLTGILPAYPDTEIAEDTPDGSSVDYTLADDENTYIDSDSDMRGDEASEAYFSVNVSSSDETRGVVTGSGIHQYGEFAQVEAKAFDGYEFAGWYMDGKCVSEEETYRFCVTDNTELVGEFREKQTPTSDTPTDGTEEDGLNNVSDTEKSNSDIDETQSVKTGDTTQIGFWTISGGISALLALTLLFRNKKKYKL